MKLNLQKIKDIMPTALAVLSVGGIALTSYSAYKAGKTVAEGTETSKIKVYAPTFIFGTATAACIIGSDALHRDKERSLIAAYTLVSNAYMEYKSKTKDICEEDVDVHIAEEKSTELNLEGDEVIFIDSMFHHAFKSTLLAVSSAEYHFNRNFQLRGYGSMGEFYRFLGLDDIYADECKSLERIGWSIDLGIDDGYQWVDFNNRRVEKDNRIYYIIEYPFEPKVGYCL